MSGAAAAKLLLAEGTDVVAVDSRNTKEVAGRAEELERGGAGVMIDCTALPAGDFEICVVSPGIAADSEWVREIGNREIPLLPELEFGARRCRCAILAITGSNGKSTMVKLCGEALEAAGRRIALAGNYGAPLSEVAGRSGALDRIVAEVSSFQLETTRGFRPDVGVVLNIQPDHLDRHGDMETYTRAKSRLFDSMTVRDTGIVFEEDMPRVRQLSCGKNGWVSFGREEGADYRYDAGRVVWSDPVKGEQEISIAGTMFDNQILGVMVAATTAAVRACGDDPDAVARAAAEFDPLPHRMQVVGEKNGVTFVNDSKATNLSALMAGLRMCEGRVHLVAGGRLKERGLDRARRLLAERVRKVYLIGEASRQMADAWSGTVQCEQCGDLERAVAKAWAESGEGDTVLLSPGCASFDQFRDFEERGERFVELVRRMTGGRHPT